MINEKYFSPLAANINSDLINKHVYAYNRWGMKMFEQRGHNSNKGDAFNLLIVILILLSFNINARSREICAWTDKTLDLKMYCVGHIQWPDKSEINGFFPLGFSKDGWFAYSENLEKIELNEPFGGCFNPPCYDIAMFNIECEEECLTDAPMDDGKRGQPGKRN